MKFLLRDGSKILSETIADWHVLDLSRKDQWHRSMLARDLLIRADRIAGDMSCENRGQRWRDLRLVANSIQNNGASSGSAGDFHWSLKPEHAEGEAA